MGRSKRDAEDFREAIEKRKREIMQTVSAWTKQAGLTATRGDVPPPSQKPVPLRPNSTVARWKDKSYGVVTSYQTRFQFSVLDPGQSLEISDVYQNGMITGEFNDRGQVYRMYFSVETREYGCSCRKHYMRQQCDHLAQFFKKIQQGLSRADSALAECIEAGKFSTKP